MTEQKRAVRGLRRGPDGRLADISDLLGAAFAGLAVGLVVLLIFEAFLALTGVSKFGSSNGWLVVILPVWLFIEEFRAAEYGAHRVMVAILGAGFAVAGGLTVAGAGATVGPVLVSGAAGAVVFLVVYCLIWFYGLRWLSHRAG